MKSFIKAFKDKLGPGAEVTIAEDRDTIREMKQRLTEAENQLQQAEHSPRKEKKKREKWKF